ncbi:MAG: hypothetical protein COC06_05230 [Bacteroidales bacterium]|nr:MAG: hypothetical protein COC06_05230 [Bacteroidales bacterium]
MNYCIKGLYATILFSGSVFVTSGKFVNATNTPKFYFAVVSVLVATAIVTLSRKPIKSII